MSAVFISYRRNDSSGHTGRIYDHLCSEFGKEYVFRDIDTIEPGTDFVDAVEKGIQECSVLIVVIGQEWLTAEDEMGRRLDDPNDFVRIEIASSLKKGLRVIPVLVKGAGMPSARDLPEEIAPLSRRLALEISDSRWDYDMQRLIEALNDSIRQDRQAVNASTQEDANNRVATDDAVRNNHSHSHDATLKEPPVTGQGVVNRRWLMMAIVVICFASLAAILFWKNWAPQGDADEQDTTEHGSFSRDDPVVNEKRLRIEKLLADAGNDIKASRLTAPDGNNAVSKYREILELEPKNPFAQRGLNNIAEVLVLKTHSALESGDLDKAEELLEQVKVLQQTSVDLEQLDVEIARRKEQRKEQRIQQEKQEEERRAQQQHEEERRQQELEEEERKAQQQHEEERRRQELEEEERKAQQQQEEERRRRELEGDERNAQQQEAERERQKLVAEKRRKQAQASRKRKICKESCSKRYQVCLKKSRPTTGDCSPQARKNCKNEHRKCLLDPQNTMIMGVSGVASHCNGQLSRCIKLKTAQCSGSKGSTGSECKKAFSSCKTACR